MTVRIVSTKNLPETGFVRLPQILNLIPISKASWYRWVSEGRAPKGLKLGPKTTAWKVEEISQLIIKLAEEQEG